MPKIHLKRGQYKRHSKEAEILRYMRMSRKISMRKAGKLNGCSDSAISQYEHGWMDVPKRKIQQLVQSYGYTIDEFNEFLHGKAVPVLDLRKACVDLLDRLDESQLRAVHAVLVGFVSASTRGMR